MKPYLKALFGLLFFLSLPACTTADPAHETPVQQAPSYEQGVAHQLSNGAVTVYSFDDALYSGTEDMNVEKAPAESFPSYDESDAAIFTAPASESVVGRAATDHRVTVYPFEDVPVRRTPLLPSTDGPVTPLPPMSLKENAVAPDFSFEPLTPASFVAPSVDVANVEPSRIYFAHDSKALDDVGRTIVNDVAGSYDPQMHLSVEGYASKRSSEQDPVERKILNLKVSMERAFNVTKALVRKGVPAESIQTTAWGEASSIQNIEGKTAEETARRVDVFSRH